MTNTSTLQNNSDNSVMKNVIQNAGSILGNFITYLPKGIISSLLKCPKFDINIEMSKHILSNGLYHCVPNESVADKIINSEYIKASSRATSYSINKWVFLFAGAPDIYSYMKNLTNANTKLNPFLNPTMVVDAIKYMPEANDLINYKCRSLNDEVMMYKGNCILPHGKVEKVKLVPDLVRDENGIPIKNENGEYDISFREATKEELQQGKNEYNAQNDYLEYISKKAKEKFYIDMVPTDGMPLYKKILSNFKNLSSTQWNTINTVLDEGMIEGKFVKNSISKNFKDVLSQMKNFITNLTTRNKIPSSVDEALKNYNLSNKNPNRDIKFSQNIANLQKQGFEQINLKELLADFSKSDTGEFFSEKYKELGVTITRSGIHGKEHSDRVALMAMIIAHNDGVFESENNSRIADILSTAAIYHDIGRILDNGPHARRGAKKVSQMDLKYLETGKPYTKHDKDIVMALIEGHVGKPNKIEKLFKKYNINDTNEQNLIRKLNSIIRDADALDRVRLDTNNIFTYKVNLNPEFIVNNSSKQMIKAAYQLENLRKSLGNLQGIIDYKKDERNPEYVKKIRGLAQYNSEFSKSLRDIPQIPTLNYDELNTTSQVSKSKEIEDR